jgi:hypothetical protein
MAVSLSRRGSPTDRSHAAPAIYVELPIGRRRADRVGSQRRTTALHLVSLAARLQSDLWNQRETRFQGRRASNECPSVRHSTADSAAAPSRDIWPVGVKIVAAPNHIAVNRPGRTGCRLDPGDERPPGPATNGRGARRQQRAPSKASEVAPARGGAG